MISRKLLSEAKLWLVAIPILLWTLIPIYHIFLFSISSKDSAFSGALSHENTIPLAVGLGHFLASDDSPWEILMATALIYALPPAAIYYAFRRYMVGGLTSGAVKS